MVWDPNKNIGYNGEPNCLLIIIDMSCEHFSETRSTLARFSKNTDDLLYKVVWIANPKISFADSQRLESRQAPCDLILQKPFHRSHLCAIIQLFQENRDTIEVRSNEIKMENIISSVHSSIKLGLAKELDQIACVSTTSSTIPHTSYLAQQRVRLENDPSDEKPLSGLRILVAEDNIVLQRLAVTTLSRLGANIECCNNGEDALNLICKALQGINEMHSGSHQEMARFCKRLSYDIILMDCEMPIMNGYEATRQIRMEERQYGLHIPIIALTAHAMAEEANKSIQAAGMDFYLVKPLTTKQLLEVIDSINNNN